MKRFLAACSLLFVHLCLFAQAKPVPNKWAIVIGISSYQNPAMSLQFADKDAKAFAHFLQSPEGGNVPESHITLLLNENATYPAIYNALDSIQDVCQQDDIVYFYFSGHGDVENRTIYKLGFLLAYNTPRTNYINNAVRIEDLNTFANTLSVKSKAKVILITDACHSGKLAGSDFRASTLIGEQLRSVQKSEIRITSCAPDQLSAEDQGWGGGRGAFSYYLVNGLNGLADADKNAIVTLAEIRRYLDSALGNDQLLRQKDLQQTPVVMGRNDFGLSVVKAMALQSAMSPSEGISPLPAALPKQPQTYFFNAMQGHSIESMLDFAMLDTVAENRLPDEIVKSLEAHPERLWSMDTLQRKTTIENLSLLRRSFGNNSDALLRFSSKMAQVLNDRGDDVIKLYLLGDAAELTRRSYYAGLKNDYDDYAHMFSVAAKLTAPGAYMRKLLAIKAQYFGGVAIRVKVFKVKDAGKLIDSAMAYQQRALLLEPNAAYIHNELGVLYLLKKNFAAAEKAFVFATILAPQWAIPWANLCGLYARHKATWNKATDASKEALRLQPDLQLAWNNAALLNQQKGHWLTAEEQYRKSIYINSRHYAPFEGLGNIFLRTTEYALADSFYFEADQRKKGFHFTDIDAEGVTDFEPQPDAMFSRCLIDSSLVGPKDIMGNFVLGMQAETYGDTDRAVKKYKQVVQLDSLNPLAFHYLGRLLFKQQRWQEASLILEYAIRNRLDADRFGSYCDSMFSLLPADTNKECITNEFRKSGYPPLEDDYLAGRVYDYWNHFAEAEPHYKAIINQQPEKKDGYYLLWRMMERTGRFRDAENTIIEYARVQPTYGSNELNSFYERTTRLFPNDFAWLYSAGNFLYQLAYQHRDGYNDDQILIYPDTHGEHYANPAAQPGEYTKQASGSIQLPGIQEEMKFADQIVFPRTFGIRYLRKADSLFSGDESVLADIDFKLGDLFVWQGLPLRATAWYEKSLSLLPSDASTRLKLVDIYNNAGQFTAARVQLDSLFNRKELDYNKQTLLAQYAMHESDFRVSGSLLDSAMSIHPYRPEQLTALNARLQWLSGNEKIAIPFYLALSNRAPENANYLYSLARCYAVTGGKEQAWLYLQKAISNGFHYSWVLKADEVWNPYRRQRRWDQLMVSFSPKKYKSPEQ